MICGKRLDGRGADAAGIVQQDHIALALDRALDRPGDDLGRKRTRPVLGIDLHADGEVAELGGHAQRVGAVNGLRLEIAAKRRPEQLGSHADGRLQQTLRGIELQPEVLVREIAQVADA